MKLKMMLLAAATLLCFQNCSQVAFQSVPADPLNGKEAIRFLEPALAVRAVGCIQCHANLSSNLVTDFGYGDSYYFGRNTGGSIFKNGSPYTDHDRNLRTVKMAGDKKVYVPQANLPAEVALETKLAKLSDYIKEEFGLAAHADTKLVQVEEVAGVYIGAPTEQQLRSSFSLGNDRRKFIKSTAAELSGLDDRGTFFANNGTLRCDGDLVVKGPLYLKDLQLETQKGCRIYVIGSVFAYGAVSYVGTSAERNLQITATRSINLGLGTALNPDGTNSTNFIKHRYVDMWTVPSQNLRLGEDPKAFGLSILAEADVVKAGLGGSELRDASVSGRTVAFERILLNAPVVMSRYNGDVKGTIVAEFALMSLGAFKFEFDPIFTQVDVLPKLGVSSFLQVNH